MFRKGSSLFFIYLAVFIGLNLTAYATSKPKLYTVKTKAVSQTLYYSGKISPIINVPVISPTQGIVDKVYFDYGALIKKGQVLMHVDTQKIVNQLRSAKIAYLKALNSQEKLKNWQNTSSVLNAKDSFFRQKHDLATAKNTYTENQHLYKLGIISKETLVQSLTAYQDAVMSYNQSARSLKSALAEGKGNFLVTGELSFATAKEKYMSLKKQVGSHTIKANATGIILKPTASSQTVNGKTVSNDIQVGSSVQYQQILLNIGNMDGLKINFNVPQININSLKPGQTAVVTGSGFKGIQLKGVVTEVAAQATTGSSSLPSFPVIVKVNKIPKADSKLIRSGMDAQIAINVYKKDSSIVIPVNAVHQNKTGKSFVYLYVKGKNKQKQDITTGKVMTKNVQVLSGLKVGQQIVMPD